MAIKCYFRRAFNLKAVFQTQLSRSLSQKPSFPVDIMQPFCHQLRGVSPGLHADKTQTVAAQDAFVRVCAQKFFHQRGEAGLLRFFSCLHLQGLIHLLQQRSPLAAGQKTVVTHHFKMLRRDMADIASDHLFLRQCLPPVLLRPVVVIVMHHGSAAVVSELRRRHRRSLQVPAQVFDASPGTLRLLREVDFPASSVLRLQIPLPLPVIADMAQPRQAAGINQIIAVAQQANDGPAPDFLHGVLLKEEVAPYAVFNIESATGDGQVDMRVLVKLATVGVQGTEDTDLHALFSCPP